MRRNVSAAIFALAFGIIQGGFLANGTAFLIADNPAPLLGIVLAGVIIFNTKEHFCTHSDAESMYRIALIFLMAGILIPHYFGRFAWGLYGLCGNLGDDCFWHHCIIRFQLV